MVRYNNEILAKVLGMNPVQLELFISSLSPDLLEYLEIILTKSVKDSQELKQYLDR